MTTVRYMAPEHHKLVAYGQTVYGGLTADFTDKELSSLRAQGIPLAAHPETDISPHRPSVHAGRRQWAQHAKRVGVRVTEDMSRDDIVAACATAA